MERYTLTAEFECNNENAMNAFAALLEERIKLAFIDACAEVGEAATLKIGWMRMVKVSGKNDDAAWKAACVDVEYYAKHGVWRTTEQKP